MINKNKLDREIERIILGGGVGVLKTDTLYGLVGSALSKRAVWRIYKLKRRSPKKPFIILISSIKDLLIFEIKIDFITRKILNRFWPGRISIILPCSSPNLLYLHRGVNSLAFRVPANERLIKFLRKTGPLIAPSVNLEGLKPAQTIKKAKKYFGNKVDFYVDSGKSSATPSTLIAIKDRNIIIERKGKN